MERSVIGAVSGLFVVVGGALLLSACAGKDEAATPTTLTSNPSCAPSEGPAAVTLAPLTLPAQDATAPAAYAGIHQVVAYGQGLYSGSAPEGPEAFVTLRRLGFKTIVSVDGAAPEAERAKAEGLKYVHLPIGYNGMDQERTLQIARAVRDLPGPVYLHCHHGKHRSAGAAGAAAVTLGLATKEQSLARMKVSGTAANYTGLFECVSVASLASAADLESVSGEFAERWKTSGMVAGMVEIDAVFDNLKEIEKAGWKTPADHPDLVAVAEAGQLADLLRVLCEDADTKAKPAEFGAWMLKASKEVEALEAGLAGSTLDVKALSSSFKIVAASCKECHVKYRD